LHYIVDPALERQMMLKLLLQPLVENAMIHGIQQAGRQGTITIMIQKDAVVERMNILVLDDGAGMAPDQLERLRANLVPTDEGNMLSSGNHPQENGKGEKLQLQHTLSDGGYGLRNVNERLLLHYGTDALLEVDSREGGGTRISFSIPILEESP
jgi:two-component system sensor histidine kinase YesM